MLKSWLSSLREFLGAVGEVLGARPLLTGLATTAALLIVLFLVGLTIIAPHSPGTEVSLTSAVSLVEHDGVRDVTLLDQDSRLDMITISGTQLWATYPHSDTYTGELLQTLQQHHVNATVDPQTGKAELRVIIQFLLPILILVTLFAFFMTLLRDQGGAFAAFSKWTGRGQRPGEERTTFADVAGAPEALVELREICDYLEDPGRYARLGARAPKGVLLVGPPGTGKTLLARAVAGEATANFFSLSGSEFVESLVGVGAARVRDLFRQAREQAPAIIFVDELDGVARQRGSGQGQGNDEREQTLNQLLVELDGFGAEAGIVVMAATNRPDILDSALLRPGRFDRQVVVDAPDVHGRTEILELYAKRSPVSPNANLARLAHQTPGFTGADLANILNEAALLAVRAGKELIDQPELEEAVDRVHSGPARKSHLLTREEVWRIAIHESGHAIVAEAIGNAAALQKVSVVARGRGRGGIAVYASEDKLMLTELDLLKNVTTMMAGVAAEQYVFGTLSTGGDGDLQDATATAHIMVAVHGMSEAIGPVAVSHTPHESFVAEDIMQLTHVSPSTVELVDRETARIVREGDETAQRIIELNAEVLDGLANALVVQETLSGPSLDVYMEAVKPWTASLTERRRERPRNVELRVYDGDDDTQGDDDTLIDGFRAN